MVHRSQSGPEEIIFHQFLLGYLTTCALLLGLGAACMVRAVASANAWWWCGVGLAGAALLVAIARYNAQTIILCGYDLVLRTGTLNVHEHVFPIWQVNLELKQSLLGRLCGYATIKQRSAAGIIVVHRIASAHTLRRLVAQRRQSALEILAGQGRSSYDLPWGLLPAPSRTPSAGRSLPPHRTNVY